MEGRQRAASFSGDVYLAFWLLSTGSVSGYILHFNVVYYTLISKGAYIQVLTKLFMCYILGLYAPVCAPVYIHLLYVHLKKRGIYIRVYQEVKPRNGYVYVYICIYMYTYIYI